MVVMKRVTFLFALVALIELASSVAAQTPPGWLNDQRLTFDPAYSVYPQLAVDSNDNAHIVWEDQRDGNREIYYTKVDKMGNPLVNNLRLTNNPAYSGNPYLAVDHQGNIHVVWRDERDLWLQSEIYYKKLDNNGQTLIPDRRLTFSSTGAWSSGIAIDQNDNIDFVWTDSRTGRSEIYFRKMNNNATNLTGDIRITSHTGTDWSGYSKITVDPQNNIHVVWLDYRGGNQELYYKKLSNNGAGLTPEIRLTFTNASLPPAIDVDADGDIHVAWVKIINNTWYVYYKKVANNGIILTSDIQLTFGTAYANSPSIATDSEGNVHIVWQDDRAGNRELYYTKLNNYGTSLTPDIRLTYDPSGTGLPSIAVDQNDTVHMTWWDARDGNSEIYYKSSLPIVLLVHGIYSSDQIWGQLESTLQSNGFSTFRVGAVLNQAGLYPNNGDITQLANQLRRAVNTVKQQTGASKVNVVAHSMGGLVTRWYIKNSYQNDINKLITLGTPNEGAPIAEGPIARFFGQRLGGSNSTLADTARTQMIPRSSFLRQLNSDFSMHGAQHTEIAGTSLPTNLFLRFLLCTAQPSYCGSKVTDSIVPESSVNIPGITCYENNVVHADALGNAYYQDQPTIDAVVSLLKSSPVSLTICPISLLGTQANSVQVVSAHGRISLNQEQTPFPSINAGLSFSASLNWTSGTMNLELVSPSGAVVNATTYQNYQNISYQSGTFDNATLEWFTFDVPEQGNWTVKVKGSSVSPQGEGYTVTLFMKKDVMITLFTGRDVYEPNETVVILSQLMSNAQPVLNATLSVTITRPDSSTTQLTLFDDGLHNDNSTNDGIYGNNFSSTDIEGTYLLNANASIPGLFQIQESTAVFVERAQDMRVENNDITFNPQQLLPGQNTTINISARIHNLGLRDAANITIEFYDGNPTTNGILLQNVTTAIQQNSSTMVSATLRNIFASNPSLVTEGIPRINTTINISIADSAMKSHDIYVRISPLSGFLESNYTNNQANKVLEFSPVTYVVGMAINTAPGIPLNDGRVIPLYPDILLYLSLVNPQIIGLSNSIASLDREGRAVATFRIPDTRGLIGIVVYTAFVTVRTSNPPIVAVSSAVPITIQA